METLSPLGVEGKSKTKQKVDSEVDSHELIDKVTP